MLVLARDIQIAENAENEENAQRMCRTAENEQKQVGSHGPFNGHFLCFYSACVHILYMGMMHDNEGLIELTIFCQNTFQIC